MQSSIGLPQSIELRGLAYHYTAYIYISGRWTPHLSIDALHTATPTARSRTMHIYSRQMDPPWSIDHRCLEYCYTKYISIAQCNQA